MLVRQKSNQVFNEIQIELSMGADDHEKQHNEQFHG